ncbi:S-adenosylmethionine decarboxylase [Paenibacillus athensensis]|uniref:S-adenosylmethionine decarboxylase n=1 Tax=Paenibacillus athensensis TaxID=1967502 RepID=A0A4Y8PSM8_9BACL|nr:S-adenosylmethionine decarboxylase [Paenibacillus athensensis]MCD1258155.1 S-adenosylmethionine decarboxylase [Paenibacillus athensensis]
MPRNRWSKKLLLYAVLALLLAGAVRQLIHVAGSSPETHDAGYLLYQVTLYQIELLNRNAGEAAAASDTKELTPFKTALGSAAYAHERLALAEGDETSLTPLDSLPLLQQYVERLQVGGSRPLRGDEQQILQTAAVQLRELYSVYAELMSSSHRTLSSKNDKLRAIDEELGALIRKKLLQ